MTRASFTVGDAKRIANAVRVVEQGNRNEAPLTFRRVAEAGGGGGFKIITFTGGWAKTTLKTVAIAPTTATMTVSNIFATISNANCSRKGAAAKIGGTWYLISAEGG